MTTPTQHASFTIERRYAASPARVFRAWADPTAKAAWFVGPADWLQHAREMDFRVGGKEHLSGGRAGEPAHDFDGYYWDIVPDRRIVYAYDMHIGERRISVSLATIELQPDGDGTILRFTEQAAFLDGYEDKGSREHGTRALLEQLAASLQG